MKIEKMLKKYRVENGKHFRLKDYDPADTHRLDSESKDEAKKLLADGVQRLAELQDILAAQDRWGMLVIFQAMDAAGKDGTIKHVMSGVNPQGVEVTSFKVPTPEEQSHGYLWRSSQHAPARCSGCWRVLLWFLCHKSSFCQSVVGQSLLLPRSVAAQCGRLRPSLPDVLLLATRTEPTPDGFRGCRYRVVRDGGGGRRGSVVTMRDH